MQNLIDRIIEIDNTAKDKVKNANLQAQAILEEGQRELAALIEKNNEKISARLSDAQKQYETFAAAEIAVIEKNEAADKKKLNDIMAEYSSRWEKDIIGRITGNKYEL